MDNPRHMRRAGVAAAMTVLVGLLAACNTVEGAGKDLERGGEKVQDAARDVKNKL